MSDLQDSPSAGSLIRSARELLVPKMSIRAAAARIGLSPEQWGNIERGYRYAKDGEEPRSFDPPAPTIAKMANVVGVTPVQLVAAGRADAAAALEKLQGHTDTLAPLAAVPDADSGGTVFDIMGRVFTDRHEKIIWESAWMPEAKRLDLIDELRAKRAELDAEIKRTERGSGTRLIVAGT